ncbi:prepilin-type N-terminal cleavage/methylation domain-containing protein [Sedimentibacter sp.]|uniref:type II secretion system protein n=1 Tax=Sedimentibacter sp. TaxID=1960295 RepID=UPI00289AF968|nr:prepilin-type N-terminal cleavage/methylation domain-containing protein [Sedimentibacter sp.]
MFRLVSKLKNKKGFTLIELIVVLAVLGIIMAIAVPRFMGVQDQARIDADKATLGLIAKTAELYYVQGRIPTDYTTGSGATIVNDSTDSINKTLLTDFQSDFPGLEFQSKDTDNNLSDVKLYINTTNGKATVTWNSIEVTN